MSEPAELKDWAEKEAAEHPERISEGEQPRGNVIQDLIRVFRIHNPVPFPSR